MALLAGRALSAELTETTLYGHVARGTGETVAYNPYGYGVCALRSEPEGVLFASTSETKAAGESFETDELNPATSSFAYWTVNGVAQRGADGVALRKLSLTMTAGDLEVVAVAESDACRRMKLFWYGDASIDDTSDTDGDGLTLVQETANRTSPLHRDLSLSGRVAHGSSDVIAYTATVSGLCTIRSEPEGELFATTSDQREKGTVVETDSLNPATSSFAYWTVNGVVQRDEAGVALRKLSLKMPTGDLEIIAVAETDACRRTKLFWYGDAAIEDTSDTDGDGMTLAQESAAGTIPVYRDQSVLGRVAHGASAIVELDIEVSLAVVRFDAVGGSCETSAVEVVVGAPVGMVPVVTRQGFDFLGWFTAAEGGEEVTAETVVTDDMTVYAHWRETDSVAEGGPYTEIVDGIEWTYVVSNGEASVGTGSYRGTAVPVSSVGPLTIPATLGGCPVTGINSYAFESCSGLTSVTIPPGVTSIGDYAFYYCYGIQSVSIPSSVKSIGREAFGSCWGLTSVVIPSGVTSIGEWAFEYCDRLTSVTIPSGVTSIGRGAFVGCKRLAELIVDSGNLVYASVDGVLYDKTKGDLIQCPGGKEGEMSISADVTSIGASAFQDCRELTSVTIPSSVTNIGHLAFYGCTGLTSVRMPASVTYIDEGLFADCSNLAMLEVDSANKFYASFDGILCNKAKTEVIQCPAGKTGKVTIPASVTNIWGHAFSGCSGLTSVTIPDSVAYIGVNAFTGCRGLTSVTIPSSETSLSFGVFESCSGLTSVVIPQGVTAIGCFAFAYCSELTSVVIPSSVTRIYYCAFASCSGLRSVTLPSGVTTIEERAFSGCKGMISVEIPKSVTNIGDSAFDACDALKTVYVAEGDAGRVRGMIEASGFDTSDLKFETVDPEPTVWKVSFDANGGACSGAARDVADGAALGELPVPTRNGYEFLGWFTAAEGGQKVTVETVVESDVTWYAHWSPIQYDIVYSGLLGASNPNPTTYTIEDAVVFAALPDVDGWTFSGWSIAGIAVGNTGDITVSANWAKDSPSIDPGKHDEPMDVSIVNTYDGVIVDADGLPMGYINVKAAKASGKGAARACSVTATILMVGEAKKVTVKGKVPVDEAAMVAAVKDGRILNLNFSKYGIWGTFDDYAIEGVRNLLQSTAKSDDGTAAKRAAEIALARFKGIYVLAYGDEHGYNGLSLTVMAKGAVKVSGKLANGVSVSTTSQLIVGDDYSVIPVIYTKGDSSLAFNVYFANDGTDTFVFGTYDAEIAPVGVLSSGHSFYTGEAISELFDDDYALLDEFLPNGVSVEPNGKKLIVAGGAAAGKIKVVDGEVVDTEESDNPSGLKLTFNTKAGTFSGSFKVYALDAKDKLKTFTATVNGVVVDGCGYGTATIKGRGSCAVVVGE